MAEARQFEALVRELDTLDDIRGKRVCDVPELALFRLRYRRSCHRQAVWGLALAVFNFALAVADFPLWWLSTIGAGVAVWVMVWSESHARTITRQLKRLASVQMARDLLEMRD